MITRYTKVEFYSDHHGMSNKCYVRKQQGVYCLNEVSLHTYIRALQFISKCSTGRRVSLCPVSLRSKKWGYQKSDDNFIYKYYFRAYE